MLTASMKLVMDRPYRSEGREEWRRRGGGETRVVKGWET
jgi:hypothetical protein